LAFSVWCLWCNNWNSWVNIHFHRSVFKTVYRSSTSSWTICSIAKAISEISSERASKMKKEEL
jgi:hypothetical protein